MKYVNLILGIFLISISLILSIHTNTPPRYNQIAEKKEIPQEQTILQKMTTQEKVGQLLIFGIGGTTLSTKDKEFLTTHPIGGILLLGRNIENETQLIQLINDIQNTNPIPLFIAIDQEGGIVSRIQWNQTLTKAQNQIQNPIQAYTIAKERGEILKNLGINMNLAPVVEHITNNQSFMYERVYRGSIEEISQKSIASIKGYTDTNIISVPKHYPGHSDNSPDSHYKLPNVNIKNQQWDEYIKPFSNILAYSDAVMVGHIKFPNIDKYPSTISSEIISQRLITNLNFNGLVITDDMEMDALNDIDTDLNMAKKALIAGNDILIYTRFREDIYQYIQQEVENGNIDIDNKVLKILKTKIKYLTN